jgi:hypothetical protein
MISRVVRTFLSAVRPRLLRPPQSRRDLFAGVLTEEREKQTSLADREKQLAVQDRISYWWWQ